MKDITIVARLRRCASDHPRRVACREGDTVRTYGELWKDAEAVARALATLGIEPGARVALVLDNSTLALTLYLGVLRRGAVAAFLNTRLAAAQLREAIEFIDPSLVVVAGSAERAALATAGARRVCEAAWLAAEALAAAGPASLPYPGADDVAVLQMTGGTTGALKAAMLTHGNLGANAVQVATVLGYDARAVCAAVLPFFHAFGLSAVVNASLVAGAGVVLCGRFAPERAAEAIAATGVTHLLLVPAMLQALLGCVADRRVMASLRACVCGAGKLPESIRAAYARVCDAPLAEGYGLSEASPVTHCNPLRAVRPGTVGLPVPGTEVRIVDPETGRPLAGPHWRGEVLVRGPQVMRGYWRDPAASAELLAGDWLKTGDIGFLDADGYLTLLDRKRFVVKIKGENVYPALVESALIAHPALADVVVVAHPHEDETLVCCYHRRRGAAVTTEELRRFARERMSGVEVPAQWVEVAAIPRTAAGKVLRSELMQGLERSLRHAAGAGPEAASPTLRN